MCHRICASTLKTILMWSAEWNPSQAHGAECCRMWGGQDSLLLIQNFSQAHTELSQELWYLEPCLHSSSPTNNLTARLQAVVLPSSYPIPCILFLFMQREFGEIPPSAAPGVVQKTEQREQAPGDGGKPLLQPGIAASWTQAGAIAALSAKDNIQDDTAKDSREMGVGKRYSLGAWWKHLSDLFHTNSSPHTNTGTQNRHKWWQLCSFSENEIPFTQDRALPCAKNMNCSLKCHFNVFQRCLTVNKRFSLFSPSLMCIMKLFFFLKRTSVAVLHNNFRNYILRVSSVNNLLLKTCTVALSVSISQQQPTSISIFKSLLSANCHFEYLGLNHPFNVLGMGLQTNNKIGSIIKQTLFFYWVNSCSDKSKAKNQINRNKGN